MAVTQASVVANLGHGTRTQIAKYSTRRALPIMASFAELYFLEKGDASVNIPRYGAAISGAAHSEAAAAVTPTSTPTVNTQTLTPVGYIASMGETDEADYRVTPENDHADYQKKEVVYALQRYPQIDSSVGISYQFTQLSSSGGNTGAALTRAGIMQCANTVWSNIKGYNTHLVAIIEGKGKQDLEDEALSNGGTVFANPGVMSEELKGLISDNPFLNENNYLCSIGGGRVHIFVEADSDALQTASSDKVGAVFVPASGTFDGQDDIMPCFGMGVKRDPMSASRKTVVNGVEDIESQVGPLALAVRSYVGTKDYILDGYGCVATAILSQSSGCKLLYSAT